MTKPKGESFGRGAAYIYFENIASVILGYFFWILLTRIAGPNEIGISSTVVSLATIFTVIINLGIPIGIQKLLAEKFVQEHNDEAREIVISSLVLVSLSTGTLSLSVLLLHSSLESIFSLNFILVVSTMLLSTSFALHNLIRSVLIASLQTKVLPMRSIVSSVGKIAIAALLLFAGFGALGIIVAWMFNFVIASFLMIRNVKYLFRVKPVARLSFQKFSSWVKEIFCASIPNWIPLIVTTAGQQLGTIVIFGSQGANQAGTYFIAFSIFSAVSALTYSLSSIAFPTLSGMTDGRKRLTSQMIKMCLIISLPISLSLMFYAEDVLRLIGKDYAGETLSLQILLCSVFPIALQTIITSLVYSYGSYRSVLGLGLASSVPRAVLYFVLVPLYGSSGAAISFLIGSVIGLIYSILVARGIGLFMRWREIFSIFLTSTLVGIAVFYLKPNFLAGIFLIIFISFLIMLAIRILGVSELKAIIMILPRGISYRLIKIVDIVFRLRKESE